MPKKYLVKNDKIILFVIACSSILLIAIKIDLPYTLLYSGITDLSHIKKYLGHSDELVVAFSGALILYINSNSILISFLN
jgi:hypothetical protein